MLTEIQWWGGLVIIWAALTLRYLTQETREDRGYYWTTIVLYVSAGLFFALYFYPLLVPVQTYPYLVLLALALLSVVVHLYLSLRASTDEQDEGSTADEEDEGGVLVSLLGYALIYGPVVTCLLIGGVRVPEVMQATGLVG